MGADAARSAATWATDGNTPTATVESLLESLDIGDPGAWNHLPAPPSLSGEWAGGPTPESVAEEACGMDPEDYGLREPAWGDLVDELASEWERGVADTYATAIEAELRKAVA